MNTLMKTSRSAVTHRKDAKFTPVPHVAVSTTVKTSFKDCHEHVSTVDLHVPEDRNFLRKSSPSRI